jgi:accessory colonization factor AcfC
MNYILICCTFIIFLFSGTLFANQSIIICGTGDSQELLKKIANAYELKNPDKKIFIPYSIETVKELTTISIRA